MSFNKTIILRADLHEDGVTPMHNFKTIENIHAEPEYKAFIISALGTLSILTLAFIEHVGLMHTPGLIFIAIAIAAAIEALWLYRYHEKIQFKKTAVRFEFENVIKKLDWIHIAFSLGTVAAAVFYCFGWMASYMIICVFAAVHFVVDLVELSIACIITFYRKQHRQYVYEEFSINMGNINAPDVAIRCISTSINNESDDEALKMRSEMRHQYASRALITIALRMSRLIIKVGRVKLPFEENKSASNYYMDEWKSCLPYIESTKSKVVFSYYRIPEAVLISIQYGVIGRYLNIAKYLKL